ncbi:hypothetical protein CRG98_026924 [Punica granatum]|uniref:Uncharacterized protein n=1 Tax=Punica granatum TaxID=22663 RepID=A0A2I0J8Y1_PUNGR|nr:hypothetical protein CRG98_026924 [Punica granatum]
MPSKPQHSEPEGGVILELESTPKKPINDSPSDTTREAEASEEPTADFTKEKLESKKMVGSKRPSESSALMSPLGNKLKPEENVAPAEAPPLKPQVS